MEAIIELGLRLCPRDPEPDPALKLAVLWKRRAHGPINQVAE